MSRACKLDVFLHFWSVRTIYGGLSVSFLFLLSRFIWLVMCLVFIYISKALAKEGGSSHSFRIFFVSFCLNWYIHFISNAMHISEYTLMFMGVLEIILMILQLLIVIVFSVVLVVVFNFPVGLFSTY